MAVETSDQTHFAGVPRCGAPRQAIPDLVVDAGQLQYLLRLDQVPVVEAFFVALLNRAFQIVLRCLRLSLHPTDAGVVDVEAFVLNGLLDHVGVLVRGENVGLGEFSCEALALGRVEIGAYAGQVIEHHLLNIGIEPAHDDDALIAPACAGGGLVHLQQDEFAAGALRPVVGAGRAGESRADDDDLALLRQSRVRLRRPGVVLHGVVGREPVGDLGHGFGEGDADEGIGDIDEHGLDGPADEPEEPDYATTLGVVALDPASDALELLASQADEEFPGYGDAGEYAGGLIAEVRTIVHWKRVLHNRLRWLASLGERPNCVNGACAPTSQD